MTFKYTMKAIPTEYGGVVFRSRLEATWAAFFDALGWDWEYEPVDMDGWCPDFLIKGNGSRIFCEVKPVDLEESSFDVLTSVYKKVRLPCEMYDKSPEEEEAAYHYGSAGLGVNHFGMSGAFERAPKRGLYTLALGIAPFIAESIYVDRAAAIGHFIEGNHGAAYFTAGAWGYAYEDKRLCSAPFNARILGLTSVEGVWGDVMDRAPKLDADEAHKEALMGISDYTDIAALWKQATNITRKQYA